MLQAIDPKNTNELQAYLKTRRTQISPEILVKTSAILEDVENNGDEALKKYTLQFDGQDIRDFRVSPEEIEELAAKADPEFVQALENARKNILEYHEKQVPHGYEIKRDSGVFLGQRVMPLKAVGIYVPGGRAQYPSSVLMNAIPAKVAGVERIVMITPPGKTERVHPNIAAAAKVAGVDEIYTVGGAQGIAALAYGTESIPAVDKIVGPGNIFVAAAKKLVYGQVDIDMIAGPSEILVIADENANPKYIAADLLSQAEHDPMASAILLSVSDDMIQAVNEELKRQSALLPKREIVEASLRDYGKSVLCGSLEECAEIANAIAPEHLELQIENPMDLLDSIKNAGSVFVGYFTCESVGDYFGGTNHVLPTSGTARFSSPLGVDAFIKKSSYMYYTPQALHQDGSQIVKMSQEEDLQAHANAVLVRLEDMKDLEDSENPEAAA